MLHGVVRYRSRQFSTLCCAVLSRSVMSDSLWPLDCSPPGSSVRGILQARILEWIAMPYSGGSSQPRDWTQVSLIAGRFLTVRATREAHFSTLLAYKNKWASLVAQLVKNPPAMQETQFDSWVQKIRWRREWPPTPVFWLGEFHGLYSLWGHKESNTTEWLSLSPSKANNS